MCMACGLVIMPYRNCRSNIVIERGSNISRKVESGFSGFLIYENDFAVVQLTW